MTKPTVTPDQFIAEMNSRLKNHPAYRKGMEFLPYPDGTSGKDMSGYSVSGPYEMTGVYAEVAKTVSDEFALRV